MVRERPHRLALTLTWIMEEIEKGSGTQFSSEVADALVTLIERGRIPTLDEGLVGATLEQKV